MDNFCFTISFGQSKSSNFKEAVRLIKKLPGFQTFDGGNSYMIEIDNTYDFEYYLRKIEDLLFLIQKWKSMLITLNGKSLNYIEFYEFKYKFLGLVK
jgi:hypothetical protein